MRPELWERVKEAFESVSDVAPEERRHRLDALDEDTRREVERMLASHDASELDGDAETGLLSSRALVSALTRDQHTFTRGQLLLDRFEIQEYLGGGGMGEVYAALDRRLGEVALKTLRLELTVSPSTIDAFQREVRRGRKVTHRNVCRIYDLFETGEDGSPGIPFFTMELLRGETLAEAIERRGPYDTEYEAAPLAYQLCDGLQAAHAVGVIHGDFKSGNIFLQVQRESEEPCPMITDFGLARLVPGWESWDRMAASGPVGGTRQYMSAEVLAGEMPSVASDLFALGVVLYQLRTGEYPFGPEESSEQARENRQTPPTAAQMRKGFGPVWAKVVASLLSPSPAQRPESALAVRQALEPAPSVGLNRRQFGWAAIGAGALVGGGWFAERYKPLAVSLPGGTLKTLVLEFEGTGVAPPLLRGSRSLFELALRPSRRFQLIGPQQIEPVLRQVGVGGQVLSGKTADTVAERTGARLLIRGKMSRVANGYRIAIDLVDRATGKVVLSGIEAEGRSSSLPTIAASLARQLREQTGGEQVLAQFGPLFLEQADTDNAEALENFATGLRYYMQGQADVAIAHLEEATKQDPQFAIAYAFEAIAHTSRSRDDLAIPSADRAFQLRNKVDLHHRVYIEHQHALLTGDWENANRKLKTLVDLLPDDPYMNQQMAQSYSVLEQPEAALQFAAKAAALDPNNAMAQNALISGLAEVGRRKEAAKALQEARQRIPESPVLTYCESYLLLLDNECDRARHMMDGLATSPDLGSVARGQIAKSYLLAGQLNEAERYMREQLPALADRFGIRLAERYRFWLGCIAGSRRQWGQLAQEAEELARVEAQPARLAGLRWAAMLGWEAGRADICRSAVTKLRTIQQNYASSRAAGMLAAAEGLEALALGDGKLASAHLDRARGYWPDGTTSWIHGEVLRANLQYAEAADEFKKVADKRISAVRFDWPVLWVRALLATAECLDAAGRKRDSQPYRAQYAALWGHHS